MSVYVGIDVHRKRSQVAVINQDGEVLANRNVPNGVEPILRVIGGLPPGTPAAFEAAFGWGWLVELLEDYGSGAAPGAPAAVQGHRLGAAEERQSRRRDLGAAAPRGPAARGVDRAARGTPATRTAAAPHPAGPAADPAAQPDPRRPGRPRSRPPGRVLERPGPGLARLAGPARRLGGGDRRRPGAHRAPWKRSPAGSTPRSAATPGPTRGSRSSPPCPAPARSPRWSCSPRPATSPGPARPASWRPGPGSPRRCTARTAWSGTGTSPGQGSVWVRWILCEAAQTAKRSPDFAARYQAIARRRGTKIATTAIARKLLTRACHLLTDASSDGAPR
jgi:transposase